MMKFLILMSLMFFTTARADFCVLTTGNNDLYGDLEILSRVDNMQSSTSYVLSYNNITVLVRAERIENSGDVRFSLETSNSVQLYPKNEFVSPYSKSSLNYLKVYAIEKDYDVTCYQHN